MEEKLYQKAKFGDKAQYRIILKSIKSDEKILDFVLGRGDKSFQKVKESPERSCTWREQWVEREK